MQKLVFTNEVFFKSKVLAFHKKKVKMARITDKKKEKKIIADAKAGAASSHNLR